MQALPRFDADRPFAPWFFTILRNVARNVAGARTHGLFAALDENAPDGALPPDEQVEYLELEARVNLELESLPDMQRACFRLCVLEGLSSTEVGEALGVSDRTVRTHVHRARKSMRKAVLPFADQEER